MGKRFEEQRLNKDVWRKNSAPEICTDGLAPQQQRMQSRLDNEAAAQKR